MTMFMVSVPDNDGAADRFLAGLQDYRKVAYPTGDGKFAQLPIDFVYMTNPVGKCDLHRESTPDMLRQIADHYIGFNAPSLADDLNELANRLEVEMKRES